MPDKFSFSRIFNNLESAISITQKRNAVIVSNISNIDVSGYRPKDINFKTAMARALENDHEPNLARTNPKHIDLKMGTQGVEPFEEKSEWNGYNWVNIDKEMTKLTENNLMYRATVETLLRKIAIIKEVIKEGGR